MTSIEILKSSKEKYSTSQVQTTNTLASNKWDFFSLFLSILTRSVPPPNHTIVMGTSLDDIRQSIEDFLSVTDLSSDVIVELMAEVDKSLKANFKVVNSSCIVVNSSTIKLLLSSMTTILNKEKVGAALINVIIGAISTYFPKVETGTSIISVIQAMLWMLIQANIPAKSSDTVMSDVTNFVNSNFKSTNGLLLNTTFLAALDSICPTIVQSVEKHVR